MMEEVGKSGANAKISPQQIFSDVRIGPIDKESLSLGPLVVVNYAKVVCTWQ